MVLMTIAVMVMLAMSILAKLLVLMTVLEVPKGEVLMTAVARTVVLVLASVFIHGEMDAPMLSKHFFPIRVVPAGVQVLLSWQAPQFLLRIPHQGGPATAMRENTAASPATKAVCAAASVDTIVSVLPAAPEKAASAVTAAGRTAMPAASMSAEADSNACASAAAIAVTAVPAAVAVNPAVAIAIVIVSVSKG